jgi:D-alanyl-lipoteichoic acid acyltransferase DltB (MBOAT superfamily)
MLFNSIDFAFFLPLVFVFYWALGKAGVKVQNAFIVLASYYFYGSWDWRFLFLIIFSTLVDFSIGILLSRENNKTKRKLLLWTSIVVNLGFLGFFKYYNFFLDNFINAFSLFGTKIQANSLDIILPVGISFYTFQTLSYTIDVYKKKLKPTQDVFAFGAFVSFFPQLVAGPIERATNLLPQFYSKRQFDYGKAVDGLRQILWGLFKKVVIADNAAQIANYLFDNPDQYSGSTLLIGAIFFTLQIYGDFSGYSDIAIGLARLFGFELKRNFAFPYFSRDIAEFWRRWHISLSTWFRDYLYIPLGGSRGGLWTKVRNTFIIFIVSGFWHGANWTFIIWGALNAIYFLPLLLLNKNRSNTNNVAEGKLLPSFMEFFQMTFTFILTVIAWVFFRAESVQSAFEYLSVIFSKSLISVPYYPGIGKHLSTVILVLFFILIEWLGREGQYALEKIGLSWKRPFRLMFYYSIIILIILFMGQQQEFIYFQF